VSTPPSVLVLAGLDPSGGAGIAADILAIAAQGAHALPVVTALTVQDNNRVREVQPVDAPLLERQVRALANIDIAAVKIGIPGSVSNAHAIVRIVTRLRAARPALPVVLDPVLSSGAGDALARGDARGALLPLLALATVLVPNLPEAAQLAGVAVPHLIVTGGHADGDTIVNTWYSQGESRQWRWPRLAGQFHGSGCTLAAAIAARLALGEAPLEAFEHAQSYCYAALAQSFAIAPGQRIPRRCLATS
jgi:hydroxymethylpyrimidine/phosphomethylpyrimidine kinase